MGNERSRTRGEEQVGRPPRQPTVRNTLWLGHHNHAERPTYRGGQGPAGPER